MFRQRAIDSASIFCPLSSFVDRSAAVAEGTSSSLGRISGRGPTGVMLCDCPKGLATELSKILPLASIGMVDP